jgi:hypothetical protein
MTSFSRRPRTVQNINDPNWFLSTNAQGDFNTISADQSGYGILSAAEKNSTYIAYFDGIGGTTPELINQTGFFIKYLIDEQGNVSQPTPDSIALLNLNTIFQGNSAIVESQDATQTLSNLIGEHSVTDIGTIQPLLITETGSNPQNYIPTMSFAQYGALVLTGTQPPNYTFLIKKPTSGYFDVAFQDYYIGSGSSAFSFTSVINSNPRWNGFDGTVTGPPSRQYGAYTFTENTGDFNVEVSFQFKMAAARNTGNQPVSAFRIRIELSTDGGTTWNRLPITNISTTNGVDPVSGYGGLVPNDELETTLQFATSYMGISSVPQQFNSGDKVRFTVWTQAGAGGVSNVYIYGLDTSQWSSIAATSNYSGELQTAAPYWDGATWPTDGKTSQYLTASLGLSGFINNDMVQLTPTASLSMSFSPIIFPANIQPGDNIRFEYDLSKTSKIYDISSLDDGRTTFKIYPAIPTGSKLDHFVIYRVVNDGNYVILNAKKESGGSMTGFLKPKYISKTLQDNLPTIINNLKRDGVIPS